MQAANAYEVTANIANAPACESIDKTRSLERIVCELVQACQYCWGTEGVAEAEPGRLAPAAAHPGALLAGCSYSTCLHTPHTHYIHTMCPLHSTAYIQSGFKESVRKSLHKLHAFRR